MANLDSIENNVKILLTEDSNTRSIYNRKRAIFRCWLRFEGIGSFGVTEEQFVKLTNAETISRAIRKVQSVCANLRGGEKSESDRHQMAYMFEKHYKQN